MSLEPFYERIYHSPVTAAIWLLVVTLVNASSIIRLVRTVMHLSGPIHLRVGVSALLVFIGIVVLLGFMTSGLNLSRQYTVWE